MKYTERTRGLAPIVMVNVDGYLMTHQKIKYTAPADNQLRTIILTTSNIFLTLPNREVRVGLTKNLLPNYVTRQSMIKNLGVDMKNKILRDDMDGALELAKEVLSNVPYCKDANTEGHTIMI